jgi:hypothetical protein
MAAPPPLPPIPPPLIKLGMWGLSSRKVAFAYFWGCVGFGVLCLLLALITPWALIGAINFIGAWWYWAVIRWVERHNARWPGFY